MGLVSVVPADGLFDSGCPSNVHSWKTSASAANHRDPRPICGSGSGYTQLRREEWTALIPNAHSGYITWEDFEENQRRLRENAQANGADRRRSPPREGPAL